MGFYREIPVDRAPCSKIGTRYLNKLAYAAQRTEGVSMLTKIAKSASAGLVDK
jgi:hypothetical protein